MAADTSAEFWLNLKRIHDRRLAPNELGQSRAGTGNQGRCADMTP